MVTTNVGALHEFGVADGYAAAATAATDTDGGCCGPDADVIVDEPADLLGRRSCADGECDQLPAACS